LPGLDSLNLVISFFLDLREDVGARLLNFFLLARFASARNKLLLKIENLGVFVQLVVGY